MLAGLSKIPSSMKQMLIAALMLVLVFDSVMANQQWANAANGLWGKRSDPKMHDPIKTAYMSASQQDNMYNFMAKRAAQWQAAQGLWGKRSDPQMQQQFYYPSLQQYQQPMA